MVFSDLFFLFAFLPAFFLVYLLAAGADRLLGCNSLETDFRCRNFSLVVFSLIFYAWGEPVYVFLMLACVLMNYVAGLVIDRQEKHRRAALIIGLVCNILILANFKYLGFLAQTLCDMGLRVSVPNISLPIGISFYTFQSISYLIDVYRRQSPVQRRFVNLLLYISMFPQLIAGPIVRYDTVAREIQRRHVSADDVAEGMFRFFLGLGKKVILANQLSELSDQFLVGGLAHLTTMGAWIGIVAYTLQIYFDFSGYSDMAIGLGAVSDSTSTRTLIIPIVVRASPASGAVGIFLSEVSSATTCTSLWGETAVIRCGTSLWCGFSRVCGMGLVGTSFCGDFILA